jgi:hypothetical protein
LRKDIKEVTNGFIGVRMELRVKTRPMERGTYMMFCLGMRRVSVALKREMGVPEEVTGTVTGGSKYA